MESAFVDAGGLRLHYRHGGSGEPVLLLHTWPEHGAAWEKMAPRLGQRYWLIAPDQRGHGKSAKPAAGYDRATLAQDMVNFLDALDIAEISVVAHGFGGLIACKMAFDHPKRVRRIVLLDGVCTAFPLFQHYIYWFADPGRAEALLRSTSEGGMANAIIDAMMNGQRGMLLPPPELPVDFQMPEWTAPEPWADRDDLDAYAASLADPNSIRASIAQHRSLQFHRELPGSDGVAASYERVDNDEMAKIWNSGQYGRESLDFAAEDRGKVFEGTALWVYSLQTMAMAHGYLDDVGKPRGDPAFDSIYRHFPRIETKGVDAGHFFPEQRPDITAGLLLQFLKKG